MNNTPHNEFNELEQGLIKVLEELDETIKHDEIKTHTQPRIETEEEVVICPHCGSYDVHQPFLPIRKRYRPKRKSSIWSCDQCLKQFKESISEMTNTPHNEFNEVEQGIIDALKYAHEQEKKNGTYATATTNTTEPLRVVQGLNTRAAKENRRYTHETP